MINLFSMKSIGYKILLFFTCACAFSRGFAPRNYQISKFYLATQDDSNVNVNSESLSSVKNVRDNNLNPYDLKPIDIATISGSILIGSVVGLSVELSNFETTELRYAPPVFALLFAASTYGLTTADDNVKSVANRFIGAPILSAQITVVDSVSQKIERTKRDIYDIPRRSKDYIVKAIDKKVSEVSCSNTSLSFFTCL